MKKIYFILFVIVFCSACKFETKPYSELIDRKKEIICDDRELDRNVYIIPDKYNTGPRKGTVFSKLLREGYVSDLYIKIGTNSKTGEKDRYILTSYVPKDVKEFPSFVVVENYDFSDLNFVIQNTERYSENKTILFKNCKFSSFANAGPYDSNKISCILDHCSFSGGVHEVNITLNWCQIGGFESDAMNPLKNFTVLNTYICNLVPYAVEKNTHIDGFQIYGREGTTGGNIIFNNVRFEIPSIHFDGNEAAVNACVMFQLEFGDVNNCYFKNLICNGGGKWFPIYLSNGKYNSKGVFFNQKNINLVNAYVSNNFGKIFYAGSIKEDAIIKNVGHLNYLYVSSVWKDEKGITHIICTNDTNIDKTLIVKTDTGEYRFEIPHCPSNWALNGERDGKVNPTEALQDKKGKLYTSYRFEDMPFDIDCKITDKVNSLKCYDDERQIRNVKWIPSEPYYTVK